MFDDDHPRAILIKQQQSQHPHHSLVDYQVLKKRLKECKQANVDLAREISKVVITFRSSSVSYFLRSVVLINSRLCCALVVVIGRREKQRRAETKVDDKDDDAREREREKCVLLFNSFYSQKFSRSFSGLTFLSEQY